MTDDWRAITTAVVALNSATIHVLLHGHFFNLWSLFHQKFTHRTHTGLCTTPWRVQVWNQMFCRLVIINALLAFTKPYATPERGSSGDGSWCLSLCVCTLWIACKRKLTTLSHRNVRPYNNIIHYRLHIQSSRSNNIYWRALRLLHAVSNWNATAKPLNNNVGGNSTQTSSPFKCFNVIVSVAGSGMDVRTCGNARNNNKQKKKKMKTTK